VPPRARLGRFRGHAKTRLERITLGLGLSDAGKGQAGN
jgi:hypothetical protein